MGLGGAVAGLPTCAQRSLELGILRSANAGRSRRVGPPRRAAPLGQHAGRVEHPSRGEGASLNECRCAICPLLYSRHRRPPPGAVSGPAMAATERLLLAQPRPPAASPQFVHALDQTSGASPARAGHLRRLASARRRSERAEGGRQAPQEPLPRRHCGTSHDESIGTHTHRSPGTGSPRDQSKGPGLPSTRLHAAAMCPIRTVARVPMTHTRLHAATASKYRRPGTSL